MIDMSSPSLFVAKDLYGSGFPQHLSNAAADSEQLNIMTHRSLFLSFWSSMVETPVSSPRGVLATFSSFFGTCACLLHAPHSLYDCE